MAALPVAQPRARSVTDRDEIASYLRTDRRYAAYAIGDLDSAASDRCSWGIAYDPDGEPLGLAMHHDGLVPQPLFLMGEPAACRAVLSSIIKPRDAFWGTGIASFTISSTFAPPSGAHPPEAVTRLLQALNSAGGPALAGTRDTSTAANFEPVVLDSFFDTPTARTSVLPAETAQPQRLVDDPGWTATDDLWAT